MVEISYNNGKNNSNKIKGDWDMKSFDEIMSLTMWRLEGDLEKNSKEDVMETLYKKLENSGYMVYTDDYHKLFLESNKDKIEKLFKDHALELEPYLSTFRKDIENTDDYIDEMEFDTNFGSMYISRYNIECVLVDELLNNQEVIDKLVAAEDFMAEFVKVCEKAEEITLDLVYDEAKHEMKMERLKKIG